MKKKLSILIALVMAISLCLMPAVAVAGVAPTYDSQLILENKDVNWDIISDGTHGLLEFDSSGPTFNFRLTAEGLQDVEYSLIYYADNPDRFDPVQWGGDNPGAVIAIMTPSNGVLDIADEVDLGINLPEPPDWNINPDPDYADMNNGFDDYDHPNGAKIWLVPTSALSNEELPVTAWPPTEYWLFETDLIWYSDTDITLTGNTPKVVAISVSTNSVDFGTITPGTTAPGVPDITVTNVGSVKVDVVATLGDPSPVFSNYLQLNESWIDGFKLAGLLGGEDSTVRTRLVVPREYSAQGPESATLIFLATAK